MCIPILKHIELWSLIELVNLYTVTFESNWNSQFKIELYVKASQVSMRRGRGLLGP